jgi:uncharacterized protein YbbC (DUF1343 family)
MKTLQFRSAFVRVYPWTAFFCLWLSGGPAWPAPVEVRPGIEILCDHYAARLAGKRVGIVTNPTAIDRFGAHAIDRIAALPDVKLVRLFAPEHGLRGGYQAGEKVEDAKDPVTGLPVVSLHGATRRPPAESLQGLDVVIYDIQDIGSRSYTFVSTLTYMMEACEKAGVAVMVLDRPDPLGGNKIGGPLLNAANRSFIGVHEVSLVYGMTPGEWARLIQRERTPGIELTVVPMSRWKRGMVYGDLGWAWVPPSEHVPRWETSFFYAMTGTLGELGVLSEGVGTPLPFEQVGAPWVDAQGLAAAMNRRNMAGVWFRPTTFRPRYGSFQGDFCQGVQIHLRDPHVCNPAVVGIALLETLQRMYPERELFKPRAGNAYAMFVKALGDSAVAERLAAGRVGEIEDKIATDLQSYLARRAEILIYP